MKVRLKKIVSAHNNLRTDSIEGDLVNPLEVGQDIFIIAEPLDPAYDCRYIRTTKVLKIEGNRYYTKNSVYELEFL